MILAEASRQHRAGPEDTVISVIDARSWLEGLPAPERARVTERVGGLTVAEFAQRDRVDTATVCRRLRNLGGDLPKQVATEVQRSNRGRLKKE